MRPLFVFSLALSALLPVGAHAQPSDRALLRYVRSAWELTEHTDDVLLEHFGSEHQGIPFRAWIGFAMDVPEVLSALDEEDYARAARASLEMARERTADYALAQVGLTGVAATAQLATWPIRRGLDRFLQAVAEQAFESQLRLYVEARTAGASVEEILRLPPGELLDGAHLPITKTDDGWLYQRGWRDLAVPGMEPEEVFAYAERLYQASLRRAHTRRELRDVQAAFVRSASEGGQPGANARRYTLQIESARMAPMKAAGLRWDFGFGGTERPDPFLVVLVDGSPACTTPEGLSDTFAP